MASAWMCAAFRLRYRANDRLTAAQRAAGWMHRERVPGRSAGFRCPCCSSSGRRASSPARSVSYSCFQQTSFRPQLKQRVSWVLSMTQRKSSHFRGNASYTSLTVSAREDRLSATASSRVAAAESCGRCSCASAVSSTAAGASQPPGIQTTVRIPSPVLSNAPNAAPMGCTQNTPVRHPPAYAAMLSTRRPGVRTAAAAVPQERPTAANANAESAPARAAPVTAANASASRPCPRQQRTSSAAAQTATPGENTPSETPPSAAAQDAQTSSDPNPGFSGGKRRSPTPMAPASSASAPQKRASSTPPAPEKHSPPSASVPQPAANTGSTRFGQHHRAATAAPTAQSRQMLRSDSSPKLWSRIPSTAPAAQDAKQSSAKPSVSPSPNGSRVPHRTAQPPANPTASALPRRSSGRTAARLLNAAAIGWGIPPRHRSSFDDPSMKKSPLSGGDLLRFWFCFPRLLHIL